MPNVASLSVESCRKDLDLTPVEKQAIASIVGGYSCEERAKIIGISEPALQLRISRICDKLCVSNEFELILFALYHHLIDFKEVPPPSYRTIPPLRSMQASG